jgi:CHAT domain-containing protein
MWDKLIAIENDTSNLEKKLQHILILKKQFEDCHLTIDSVYARILHKSALYEYELNNEVPTKECFDNTIKAIKINTSGIKGASETFAVNSYKNVAVYYNDLSLYKQAYNYFDSAIIQADKFLSQQRLKAESRIGKSDILLDKNGDYEKCIDECTIGLYEAKKNNDSTYILKFFNQRADACFYQGDTNKAISDADSALFYATILNDADEYAKALKTTAYIYEARKLFLKALMAYKASIEIHEKAEELSKMMNDYIDLGNFYTRRHIYPKAKSCFLKSVELGRKTNDLTGTAKAHQNLGVVNYYENNLKDAGKYYLMALEDLKVSTHDMILNVPKLAQFNFTKDNDLLTALLNNYTHLLICMYNKTHNTNYLSASLKTAQLTNSFLTKMLHEQLGEQSKLYWRQRTKEFFTYAIEASFLYNDPELAFNFMEKSKAVLLNDKLNELNASNYLSKADASKQENYQIKVLELQQKLSTLVDTSIKYRQVQSQLVNTRADIEHFIATLDQKYPVYYQYKYDDYTPSLKEFQNYLSSNQQSFVDYFFNDTVCYLLGVTPDKVTFIKRSANDIGTSDISTFLRLCSNKEKYFRNHALFNALSNKLYKVLFEPLNIPKGRTIICPDNFLIPFETLCTDSAGKNFLINNYAFSYTYSARYLMKHYNSQKAAGSFIGFAPASFSAVFGVTELQKSVSSLEKCASCYKTKALFINDNASKHNFLSNISNYTVANVFSHATGNIDGDEPRLFMHDSIIKLPELQLLRNPATQLVILSACETDVGKNAAGEGIYSLARGFSAAGIPAVAATLWNADEESIYTISEKFHEYLAAGIPKDEALQKAKIYYIQKSGSDNQFPFYWANMILIGNSDPLLLTANINTQSHNYAWWIFLAAAIILTGMLLLKSALRKNKEKILQEKIDKTT